MRRFPAHQPEIKYPCYEPGLGDELDCDTPTCGGREDLRGDWITHLEELARPRPVEAFGSQEPAVCMDVKHSSVVSAPVGNGQVDGLFLACIEGVLKPFAIAPPPFLKGPRAGAFAGELVFNLRLLFSDGN